MTSIEIQSLYDALNAAMVSELPKPIDKDEKSIWIKGIARVYKSDCSKNWAIVRNDGYGKPSIVQDFGHSSIIVKIEEVHPYQFLKGKDMPVLQSKTDMVSYLSVHGEDESEIKEMLSEKGKTKGEVEQSRKDVMALIINYAEQDIEKRIRDKEAENEIYEERIKEAENGIK